MSRLEIEKIKESQVILVAVGDIMVGDFPESEKASREVLSLPIYPEIEEGEQRGVVERLSELTRRLSNA